MTSFSFQKILQNNYLISSFLSTHQQKNKKSGETRLFERHLNEYQNAEIV